MINGSPHKDGNTAISLQEMAKVFASENVEYDILNIGSENIRGCVACLACKKLGHCVQDDIVNKAADLFKIADALVVASPVYFASANGTVISFLDRLFYSSNFDKTMKVGASIAVARRGGTTATYDLLNKYFAICGMPIATSQYWNSVHGMAPGEAKEDAEGLQTMRTLARNMIFLMKAINLGKAQFSLPQKEAPARTNFIH